MILRTEHCLSKADNFLFIGTYSSFPTVNLMVSGRSFFSSCLLLTPDALCTFPADSEGDPAISQVKLGLGSLRVGFEGQ
jgi:hypothetical protein